MRHRTQRVAALCVTLARTPQQPMCEEHQDYQIHKSRPEPRSPEAAPRSSHPAALESRDQFVIVLQPEEEGVF
jgi:hypothetical protein